MGLTYIVTNRHGEVQARHLSAADAAAVVMQYDSHDFDVRPAADGRGFELWITQRSQASTLGGRPMVKSVIYSLVGDRAAAEAEIYAAVLAAADAWCGCQVMADDEYDAQAREMAAEEAAWIARYNAMPGVTVEIERPEDRTWP